MGCWKETDMLTNLPIDYGEPVAAVLIAQERESKRTSYPHQTWTPVSPLIYGTYDDYGRIEGYDENTERLFLDVFREAEKTNIRLIKKNENGTEAPFLEPDTALADIIGAAVDGTLFLQNPYKAKRVALVLLKPDYVERCKAFPTAADICREFAKFKTARRLMTGAFSPGNPLLDFFYTAGADIATIFCINEALHALRSVWHPTSGAGSQAGIECQEVVDWYQSVAEDADDSFTEYEHEMN